MGVVISGYTLGTSLRYTFLNGDGKRGQSHPAIFMLVLMALEQKFEQALIRLYESLAIFNVIIFSKLNKLKLRGD